MKKIPGILLICLAFNGWAQNSLLFEIKSPDSDHTSYLFGTLHMADNKAFQWNDSVLWAIDQTEKALFELDLDTKKLSGQSGDLKKMMNEWEAYFKKEIAPEVEQLIDADTLAVRAVSVYGQVLDMAKKMRDTDRSDFVDQFLQDYARKQGKEIVGIETAAEQLEALTSVDKDQLKKAIIKFVKKDDWDIDLSAMLGDQNMLIDAYAKLSLDEVCEMMNDVVTGSSNSMVNDLYERLLVTRNEIMYDRVKHLVANEPVFIGVGAGHLCGKTGLIERFTRAGYVIRPIDVASNIEPLNEWTTYSSEKFSVKVPEQVSNFYLDVDMPSEYDYSRTSVSTPENVWYTHKGKVKFTINSYSRPDSNVNEMSEQEKYQRWLESGNRKTFGEKRHPDERDEPISDEEIIVTEGFMPEEVEAVAHESDTVYYDAEVIDEPKEEMYVITSDDGYEEPPAPEMMEDFEVVEDVDAVPPAPEYKVREFDSPPAVEYNESKSESESMNRRGEIDELPHNEEYWERFGKRMKKEMMTVMFSGFAGFGAKGNDDQPQSEPVYVEVMGQERKLTLSSIGNSTMTYELWIEHEDKTYKLKLTGDSTAFEDAEILRFFTSFTLN